MNQSSIHNPDPRSTRNRVVFGTIVTVLLLSLLLALLSLLFIQDLGSGKGRGSGVSSGDGTGNGTDSNSDADSGHDSSPDGAAGEPESDASPAETAVAESPPRRRRPERERRPPPPAEQFVLGALPETAEPEAPAGSRGFGTGTGTGSQGAGGPGGNSSEFFGIKSKGRGFVYIVDQSGSMSGDRFARACSELLKAIQALSARQSFYVYFFTDSERLMFDDATRDPKLIKATAGNKRRIREWVATLSAGGGNGAETRSILDAVSLRPDAIYFLSDGGFDPDTANQVRAGNSAPPVPVNTIGFGDRSYEELLKQIAQDSGGKYRFVP